MILRNYKNLFLSVTIFVLIFSFLFCCGASWHEVLLGNDHSMDSHSACGMTDVGGQASSSHTQSIIMTLDNLLNNFSAIFLITLTSLILAILLRLNKIQLYSKLIRGRYGSFRRFNNFIYLFRLGILNSKVY